MFLSSFAERPTYLSIESDKKSFRNFIREIDALMALGYDLFQAVEQSQVSRRQSAPYPAREGEYVNHHFAAGSSGLFGKELEGKWKSRDAILKQYRLIHLGYRLVRDDGIISIFPNWGAGLLRRATSCISRLFIGVAVPG